MNEICTELHVLFNNLKRFQFPFNENDIPKNGIYVLFESGEKAHQCDRIVRVGTHTGENQLRSRLKQHYINENKDRSIFRKNIGRALLNREKDPFLKQWNWDLTTRKAKNELGELVDWTKQKEIERQVSAYIQKNLTFAVFEVIEKGKRLNLESKMISTMSWCGVCSPSDNWLGLHSPKARIRESGLWLVNELYKEPLDETEFKDLASICKRLS
jgi:hypothetical protein